MDWWAVLLLKCHRQLQDEGTFFIDPGDEPLTQVSNRRKTPETMTHRRKRAERKEID